MITYFVYRMGNGERICNPGREPLFRWEICSLLTDTFRTYAIVASPEMGLYALTGTKMLNIRYF